MLHDIAHELVPQASTFMFGSIIKLAPLCLGRLSISFHHEPMF